MADNKYPYSAELKAPADNSKVDYDDPKTIAGMAKIGKMTKTAVTSVVLILI